MQIVIMNLKSFWERHRAQRWSRTAAPATKARPPKPFLPLTGDESIAVLNDVFEWFTDEIRTMLAMPDGPSKEHRRAELRARHQSMARDYERLVRRRKAEGYDENSDL